MANVVRKLKREVFVLTLAGLLVQRPPVLPGYRGPAAQRARDRGGGRSGTGPECAFRGDLGRGTSTSPACARVPTGWKNCSCAWSTKRGRRRRAARRRASRKPARPPGCNALRIEADVRHAPLGHVDDAPALNLLRGQPGWTGHHRPQGNDIGSPVSGYRPSCRRRSP